jgi:ZIP family zinc transporter
LHSLIDGVAIGLAFQASSTIGAIVAIAVVAHRFSDGINTVGVILKHRGKDAHARTWLSAVAIAPLVGTAITFAISVSDSTLAIILALFAGFFLYIGASDLIPEGHHSHSKILTTVMTILGAAILYAIVSIASL